MVGAGISVQTRAQAMIMLVEGITNRLYEFNIKFVHFFSALEYES